jgi:hypothetical protein
VRDGEATLGVGSSVSLDWRQCIVVFSRKRVSNYRSGWILNRLLSWRGNTLLARSRISAQTSFVFGRDLSRFVLKMYFYQLAFEVLTCRIHLPFQSAVGGIIGGDLTVVSIKFRRTPLLHTRLDFRQF